MTAADVLVESLMDGGVDTVFGLPGDGIGSRRELGSRHRLHGAVLFT